MTSFWVFRAAIIGDTVQNATAWRCPLDEWSMRVECAKAFDRLHGERRQLLAPLYLPNAWAKSQELRR